MQYAVKIMRDQDLPEGHDWCVIRAPGELIACVKRSRASDPKVLAEAWVGVRQAQGSLAPEWDWGSLLPV